MTYDSSPDVHRESFHSCDVAAVEHYLGRTYSDMVISVPGDPAEFECRHDLVAVAGIGISRLRAPVRWSADLDPMTDQIVVEHLNDGGLGWRSPDFGDVSTGAGDTVLVPPSGTFGALCDHLDVDIVGLDSHQVADHAEQISGLPPNELAISAVTPISDALAHHWLRTVDFVRHDVLGNPFAARSPIVLDSAFRSLATALLSTFPNNALARVSDPHTRAPRGDVEEATLREIVDYLRNHADRPVSPRDVTELAGVPSREIVAGLRRRLDVHPARLLWDARLAGAYQDLRDHAHIPPTDVASAVAEIAARWGFTDLGSFRLAFARAFDGVTPEQVLAGRTESHR